MIKISNIKSLGSNKYELIINNKKHIILGDVLLDYNILTTKQISEKDLENILNKNSIYENYNKMVKYILSKLRTEKEIRIKLFNSHVENNTINDIIKKLKDNNYINDEKYIKAYINDNINLTLNGPKKISSNLVKLGFNDSIINKYLHDFSNIWEDRVNKVVIKKVKAANRISYNALKNKIKRELYNMGYDEYIINKALDNIKYDEADSLKKEFEKWNKTYQKKYQDNILKYKVNTKLKSLGYDIDNI